MTENTEPNFSEDKEAMEQAVNNALNELTRAKAYTLKAGEIEDFKAAQYALRNLSPEHGDTTYGRYYTTYETRVSNHRR